MSTFLFTEPLLQKFLEQQTLAKHVYPQHLIRNIKKKSTLLDSNGRLEMVPSRFLLKSRCVKSDDCCRPLVIKSFVYKAKNFNLLQFKYVKFYTNVADRILWIDKQKKKKKNKKKKKEWLVRLRQVLKCFYRNQASRKPFLHAKLPGALLQPS